MATYKFGSGVLFDYYAGGTFSPLLRPSAFTGFPYADFNDFDSPANESPAVPVEVIDLARWYWKVKTWDVTFSQSGDTWEFASQALDLIDDPNELGLLQYTGWQLSNDATFFLRTIINSGGDYGCQSTLQIASDAIPDVDGEDLYLTDGGGGTLIFTNLGEDHTATAVESTYWDWLEE